MNVETDSGYSVCPLLVVEVKSDHYGSDEASCKFDTHG